MTEPKVPAPKRPRLPREETPIQEETAEFARLTRRELSTRDTADLIPEGETQVLQFRAKPIREVFHNNEWYFAVVDVVGALTDSPNPADYIKKIRSRDQDLSEGWGQFVTPLTIATEGGPQQVNCANLEGLLRIVQSIPSPKAEPFKRWLAKVGYERIQEIQNPEIAIKRAILLYQLQGRSNDWIDARIRTIVSRKELTGEWKARGVQEGLEYATLTNIISEQTFGMHTERHKKVKSLKRHHNLRDHMTQLELILTMLGERSTTEIARKRDARGFYKNAKASEAGGRIAGDARRSLERELGTKVVSPTNFLTAPASDTDPLRLTAPKKRK